MSPGFRSETGDPLEVRHVACGHTLFMGQGNGSDDEVEITNRTTAQGGIIHEFAVPSGSLNVKVQEVQAGDQSTYPSHLLKWIPRCIGSCVELAKVDRCG